MSRVTQGKYERGEGSPDTEYWAKLIAKGMDVQYVLGGIRSNNLPNFQDKLAELSLITERLETLARKQVPRPDPYLLITPLRELVWQARLSDQQIQLILDLLHAAREPGFWLGVETNKGGVTQNIHGTLHNSQVNSGDMTISNVYHPPADRGEEQRVHEDKQDYKKPKK